VLIQHVLVVILVVVFPLWDHYEIPRLKASTDPGKRVRLYKKIIAAEWICALTALLAVGFTALMTIRIRPGEIAWLAKGSRGSAFMTGMVSTIVVVLLLPAILAIWSEKVRVKAAKAAKSLSYLLPWTPQERLWWWPVCITAGVCEEVLYRGFLLHYFHTAPFHLTLTRALIVASVIFGIGHLYQGIKGALATAILGFALAVVFVLTGSLLIPMVAHALVDLRVLLMIPAGQPPEAATPA